MKKVLFLCYGNIIRSQMAEAFYNHLTISRNATSAGVHTIVHNFTSPIPEVVEVMKEKKIDVSGHKVTIATKEMADGADEIYVLTKKFDCPTFVTESNKVTYWDVEDPFGKPLEAFRKARDLIEEKVRSIIES